MPELNEERLLTTAFADFRASASPHLRGGAGSAQVRSTVRRRRTAHRLVGVFAATLVLAAAAGFGLSRGPKPAPPALPPSPSATAAPTHGPNPARSPSPPATPDSAGTGDTAARQPADLAVSASYLVLNGGAGAMIVRIDNVGQVTVNSYRLTVYTPKGLHVTAALGDCVTDPVPAPYRGTCGPLKPGETAHVNLTIVEDAGTVAGNAPANQRTVTVQPVGAVDASKKNDTTTYLIKTAR